MGKFNEYSQKATPADNDTLMIYDATSKANKLSPFSGIWNWIVGKLTNAVISNLQTSNKTVVGALNELNSKPLTVESDDLNNVSGGLTICHWKLQTANTPRTENLTTASSGIVFSYLESEAWAVQFGMIPADKNWYVRVKSSGEWSSWGVNLPGIEVLTKTITVESGKQAYDLQINATEYMIISIQAEDRMGWQYTVTRGVSGTEATQNWAVCFIGNPTGTFTFKVAVLKIK